MEKLRKIFGWKVTGNTSDCSTPGTHTWREIREYYGGWNECVHCGIRESDTWWD